MNYKAIKQSTALGIQYVFEGPGISRFANGVHFLQIPCGWAVKCLTDGTRDHGSYDADTILRLLATAFEAGRQDAKCEIRRTLGINQ